MHEQYQSHKFQVLKYPKVDIKSFFNQQMSSDESGAAGSQIFLVLVLRNFEQLKNNLARRGGGGIDSLRTPLKRGFL